MQSLPQMGVAMTDRLLVPTDFDYTTYDSEVADQLREAADRIRAHGQDQIAAIIDTGKALASVKKTVGHGNWGPWLASEFNMSVSTAGRYIRAAEFADKFVTVTNLSPSMLYLVSAKSTPPSLAQEVIDRATANEPLSGREVQCRLDGIKEQKGTALAAPEINREPDRVTMQQDPPSDRRETAALAADWLEQITRLVAKVGDPVDVIKALILHLDGAATERFNRWYVAHSEPSGTASTRADESLTSLPQPGAGKADQPKSALVVAADDASDRPLAPSDGPEGAVVGNDHGVPVPHLIPAGPASSGGTVGDDASALDDVISDLVAGNTPGSIEPPPDSGTGDAEPGVRTSARRQAPDVGSAAAPVAPGVSGVSVSSLGIDTRNRAENDVAGPAALGGGLTEPAAGNSASEIAPTPDGGFGDSMVGDSGGALPPAPMDSTAGAQPEPARSPQPPQMFAERPMSGDTLRDLYDGMNEEERGREGELAKRYIVDRKMPENPSRYMRRLRSATLTERANHARYLGQLQDVKRLGERPIDQTDQQRPSGEPSTRKTRQLDDTELTPTSKSSEPGQPPAPSASSRAAEPEAPGDDGPSRTEAAPLEQRRCAVLGDSPPDLARSESPISQAA
jgi:hypothetical protein